MSSSTSDFKSIIDAALSQALSEYEKKTGTELLDHPLATELQRCDSVDAILAILQGQAEAFQQFRAGDQRLMKWISPVVDILYTFSGILAEGAGLVFPPAKVVFTGIGILLFAAKDVRASHDAFVELFERIESFFKRLGVYTQISLTAEMAEVFVKIVAEVLSILSVATKEVKRTRAKIYFRKILGNTDIEDSLKRLDSLIQEEVRMATAQTMKATFDLKDDAKTANDKIDEIKWNQIEQDVRKWFSPPDPSTNHNTACDVYHKEPPNWFFGARVFRDWMSNGSFLWIHGKPGSGKSIVCSAIIQHIMRLRDSGEATLAYFYFDFRDEEKRNVRNFVTSLLVQLSAYSEPCCDIIYRLYLAHGKGTQQPNRGILINRLKEMLTVAAQHPIFIIMDALDECPDSGMPTPREAVLNLVKDLVHLRLPNLRICVSSRPEIDIQTKLKPLTVNAISLHDERGQSNVISNYVRTVVSSDEHMKKWRDEDKKLIVKEISERADGMFQWVFCQLETLRHAVQPDVRGILEALPRTLDETYERMLKNINEKNRKHARRLLHCLAVAVRPLRVEELAEILTFDFNGAQGGIPKFHADRRPEDQEGAVLSICSSLIAIVDNQGSRVVQFSHLSVKEFLTSCHLASSSGDLSLYHILPGPAHTILAQVCLGLLLHLDFEKSVGVSPLAEYAARHWVAHAQFEGVASRVMDGMKSLFDPDKSHFAAWIGLFDIDAESGGRLPSEIPNPLYYSALCGIHDLVRHLAIKHPQHVNTIGGSHGFPLAAALCRNHLAVAELLFEHGGSVDVRDTRKQTVLHKIIDRHGDKVAIDAVQFLLERGADVNARRDNLWTPLHLAVNIGELSVARMLLEHQADVNSRNNDGQAPLHLLSRRETSQDEDGGSDIAKLLLERGANVNEKDKDDATPLHLASYNKRLKIVRVLLDHGANVDAERKRGGTPLQIVLRGNSKGQEDGVGVARLLLEHGAEAYARDKYHISTSDLACCFGKEKTGRVLLGTGEVFKLENNKNQSAFWRWIKECGVGGNVQDKYDTILLHSASYYGRLEMARMLLNHGVKSNAQNHLGETALHVVSRGKYDSQDGVRIAQLLLERGVDVNAQRKDHWTPIHVASYQGRLKLARLFLRRGANANAKTDNGETPLHGVSCGEYQSQEDGARIAQLLLERGVDVNTQRKNHWTALHVASNLGKLAIARVLLDRGANANANAKTGRGETPLHRVARGDYPSQEDGVRIAQLLLEHGVDVNTQRTDHWTALHVASNFGKLEIARVLLDRGANVIAKTGRGEIPLHRVSRGEYESQEDGVRIAQLLLERGVDVNTQRKNHWTALHIASNFGKLEIARVLLDRGANANAKTGRGEIPLHRVSRGEYEAQEDGVRVAQLLLERGVDVNTQRKDHWTALHVSSNFGKPEITQLLLDRGANVNAKTGSGEAPLHRVARGDYQSQQDGVRVAQLLLERGVDVNTQRKDRWTALHVASNLGKLGIAQLLLDRGANVNAKTGSGETPLHRVARGGYQSQEDGVRVAQLLLERGMDVNTQRKDYWTALHVASNFGKLEIAQLLLDRGANVNAKTDSGEAPLHRVARGGYQSQEDGVRVAQLLLERGMDVNTQRKDYWTALHVASHFGKLEIARVLLDRGANVNAKTGSGETPLHRVARGGYQSQEDGVRIAQLLLERGVDVNAQRKDHWTPLHVASHFGKLDIARVLLNHGAKVDVMDVSGKTPSHLVSQGTYDSEDAGVDVARLLLEHGADVNAKARSGETPLGLVNHRSRRPKLAQLLLENGAIVDAQR